jgi:hypothetical protein
MNLFIEHLTILDLSSFLIVKDQGQFIKYFGLHQTLYLSTALTAKSMCFKFEKLKINAL